MTIGFHTVGHYLINNENFINYEPNCSKLEENVVQ